VDVSQYFKRLVVCVENELLHFEIFVKVIHPPGGGGFL
jgi:hypothetical protein